MRRKAAALALLALAACDRAEDSAAPPLPSSEPPSDATIVRELSAAPAFDVVSHGDGVVLAWADATGVRALAVTSEGELAREATIAGERGVLEVAAAFGNTLGVAWVAGEHAAVVMGDPVTLSFNLADTLGPSEGGPSEHRGRIAMSAAVDGRLTALARGPGEPCERGGAARCATFTMHRLPPDGSPSSRPRLLVPHPCYSPVAALALTAGTWHYALCDIQEGHETTVLFSIQHEPPYAQADHLLAGCDPAGSARIDDELWLTARCGGVRTAVRARGIAVLGRPLDLSRAELACNADDTPALRPSPHADGLTLSARDEGVAALLPSHLAPRGSRAALAGKSLFVAAADQRAEGLVVQLVRYRCAGGQLVSD